MPLKVLMKSKMKLIRCLEAIRKISGVAQISHSWLIFSHCTSLNKAQNCWLQSFCENNLNKLHFPSIRVHWALIYPLVISFLFLSLSRLKSMNHHIDKGKFNPCFSAVFIIFIIFAKSSVPIEPPKRALNNPAPFNNLEFFARPF